MIDGFIEKIRADQDPWERRFAQKFGIALAAAILVSEFGLAPWSKKRARRAIIAVYKKARATSVSADEAADGLVRVLRELVKSGKRFPQLNKGQALSSGSPAWGAVIDLPNGDRVVATPLNRVEALVKPSAITGPVLGILADRKVVLKSNDGKLTNQVMRKGLTVLTGVNRPRLVCFAYKKIMQKS